MRLLPTLAVLLSFALPVAAESVDRAKVKAFVQVTGYDVIINSLQQNAMNGPAMVGGAPKTFGEQYTKLAEAVFDPVQMNEEAIDLLAKIMTPELLTYGADFYASDLGQRLVAVENESHFADDEERLAEGMRLAQDMASADPERLKLMERLSNAVGSTELALQASVEMQVQFLLAAMASGAVPQTTSEAELRGQVTEQMEALRAQLDGLNVVSNVYTYRAISTEDVKAYAEVLESEEMRSVYEALNAVQYKISISRYHDLGARMGELKPQTDL